MICSVAKHIISTSNKQCVDKMYELSIKVHKDNTFVATNDFSDHKIYFTLGSETLQNVCVVTKFDVIDYDFKVFADMLHTLCDGLQKYQNIDCVIMLLNSSALERIEHDFKQLGKKTIEYENDTQNGVLGIKCKIESFSEVFCYIICQTVEKKNKFV